MLVDLNLNPKAVLKLLGIKCKLEQVDWQVVKEYPFGTLGYDYEEGLKVATTPEGIVETVNMLKKLFKDNHIPKTMVARGGFEYNTLQVRATDSTNMESSIRLFNSIGLSPDARYPHIYTL